MVRTTNIFTNMKSVANISCQMSQMLRVRWGIGASSSLTDKDNTHFVYETKQTQCGQFNTLNVSIPDFEAMQFS